MLVLSAASTSAIGSTDPALLELTLESGWLLVDEEDGTERLVPEPPPLGTTEILYTARFRYLGAEPVAGLRIEIPMPEGVHYVAGSATGPGATVSYSVNGVVFAPAGELSVPTDQETLQARPADQETLHARPTDPEISQAAPRRADPEDYGHIRWELPGEFPPGAAGLVSFRARPVVDVADPAPMAGSADDPAAVRQDAEDLSVVPEHADDPATAPEEGGRQAPPTEAP